MSSLYLNRLSFDEKRALQRKLWESQNHNCFICEKEINLDLHESSIDIDHVEPIKVGGKDDPINFALTHASCNRSKQASDLRVARVLSRFSEIREACAQDTRGPNLSDILSRYGGAQYELSLKVENGIVSYSFPEIGDNEIRNADIYKDVLSGINYFFANLPISYLFHDDRINPRAIGANISKLVEEFFRKRPQLHISLAWIQLSAVEKKVSVKVFDGQHKAAAQVLLGVQNLPVRVFINPDIDVLLTTNTNAGTTLRQVAFDKSVQRHLGSALFNDRLEKYREDHSLPFDSINFSERDLVKYFKGESREMKRYILDDVRDSITHHPENKLKSFIDFGGRAKEKPLSYSTVEKTFYSFFIYQEVLDTPLSYRLEEGDNPRELEKEQILKLMNIIAEELYISRFDPDLGTDRIENKLQKGENIPENHLRAFRMSKEEIIYNWLRFIHQITKNYFLMQGKPLQEEKLFQYRFPEPLWDILRTFVKNMTKLPLWVNKDLSVTVFGGRQNYQFWQTIFETGKSPQGQTILAQSINLMEMIREP
jgi:hypothetical protein